MDDTQKILAFFPEELRRLVERHILDAHNDCSKNDKEERGFIHEVRVRIDITTRPLENARLIGNKYQQQAKRKFVYTDTVRTGIDASSRSSDEDYSSSSSDEDDEDDVKNPVPETKTTAPVSTPVRVPERDVKPPVPETKTTTPVSTPVRAPESDVKKPVEDDGESDEKRVVVPVTTTTRTQSWVQGMYKHTDRIKTMLGLRKDDKTIDSLISSYVKKPSTRNDTAGSIYAFRLPKEHSNAVMGALKLTQKTGWGAVDLFKVGRSIDTRRRMKEHQRYFVRNWYCDDTVTLEVDHEAHFTACNAVEKLLHDLLRVSPFINHTRFSCGQIDDRIRCITTHQELYACPPVMTDDCSYSRVVPLLLNETGGSFYSRIVPLLFDELVGLERHVSKATGQERSEFVARPSRGEALEITTDSDSVVLSPLTVDEQGLCRLYDDMAGPTSFIKHSSS